MDNRIDPNTRSSNVPLPGKWRTPVPLLMLRLVQFCWLLVPFAMQNAPVSVRADEPVDFDTQIMAVISKNGCNAASCHGSAGGRGGFQLSLFGSDPDLDYDQIVRERQGRRIHLNDPENSLVLQKATDSIGHEGGLRFDSDSREYRLVHEWISQGAGRIRSRELERIEIDPPSIDFENEAQMREFRVLANFSDGQKVDVSQDAVISLLDEESLFLDGTVITVRRPGQHSVLVRYLDQVGLLQVTLPYAAETSNDLSRRGFIDDAINSGLNRLGISPVSEADDRTLYRRLSLDLLGELPDAEVVQAFAESKSPDKFEQAVDSMLADARFVELWTWHLAEWLRVGGSGQDEKVASNYQHWIRKIVRDDASLARLATESLTATGSPENGATGFYRLTSDPGIQAELACNTWMGVRVGCANCHNHPLDHWKRTEYFQFAGFFAGIRRSGEIRVSTETTLVNPVTGKLAVAALPDGEEVSGADPRKPFAEWLTKNENPYFARSTANRIWAILMGRGVYEPVDDFRETNPVSNQELLDGLANFHAVNNFQLRPLIREIVVSSAWRRQTSIDPVTSKDRFFWRFMPRELPAPVLLEAIDRVTLGESKMEQTAWTAHSQPGQIVELVLLGQCDRNANCLPASATGSSQGGLAGNLELMIGRVLNSRISERNGFLMKSIEESSSDLEILEQLYLIAYSRSPNQLEQKFWLEKFTDGLGDASREKLWQDIMWAILNSREFVTNH